jgi:response regulator RpfG family c-di-GMP phosphodiesterase
LKNISRFLIIDDDPVVNCFCKMLINHVDEKIEVRTFTVPEKGFEFITSKHTKDDQSSSIILLDLNMPQMTGWEFLERFEELDEQIKKQLRIYIHSSSFDWRDRKRALTNKNVQDYIVKPITEEIVKNIIG